MQIIIFSSGVNSTAAAIVGVTILLVSGVLDWDDCLANKSAWNTFTWFAAVIAFATQLKTLGFVRFRPCKQLLTRFPPAVHSDLKGMHVLHLKSQRNCSPESVANMIWPTLEY